MLQRMKTLATQSANGTYTTEARANIKKEFDQLKTEIDRIADTTEFSGVKPLTAGTGGNMTFQIGTSNVKQNLLNITAVSMKAADLGKNVAGGAPVSLDAVDLSTLDGANKGMAVIEKAITNVSDYRAELGAAQNRLEHTVNNLNVTSENITAAESRIRDTDMADEMTAFTKNNILAQAAQSMLAQANAQPQGILSLLQ